MIKKFIFSLGLSCLFCLSSLKVFAEGDTIFSEDGGFIITEGMLDKRVNEITFPGTHNSFANNEEDRRWPESMYYFTSLSQNHYIKIQNQLNNGIRYVELDVNNFLDLVHGTALGGHAYLDNVLEDIKSWAASHPNQIVIVRVSNIVEGLTAYDSYHRINGRIENTGLSEYIYNWDWSAPKDDPRRCYIPNPMPTLREMIDSNKNVLFIHNEGYDNHNIFDRYHYEWNDSIKADYTAQYMEQLDPAHALWNPSGQGDNRMFIIEFCADNEPAGDKNNALKNNDGRRLYKLAKYVEAGNENDDPILPNQRRVNVISVDYFCSRPVSVVDACNRLNDERLSYDMNNSTSWTDSPRGASENLALNKSVFTIDGDTGQQGTNNYEVQNCDGVEVQRIPSNAVDGNLFTRWTAKNDNANHGIIIDLGEIKTVSQVAIAWEFGSTQQPPGYEIMVSNDKQNWSTVYTFNRVNTVYDYMDDQVDTWDLCTFTGRDTRYVGVKITHSTNQRRASLYEIEIYK